MADDLSVAYLIPWTQGRTGHTGIRALPSAHFMKYRCYPPPRPQTRAPQKVEEA